jgi:AbrB family looped-hinge helix DNA binding protein
MQCDIDLTSQGTSCCNVDAIISVDGRGQIVLPKDLREKAHIKAGDKFAVISWNAGGKVCCISLVKTDDFADTVKSTLGPMLKEIVKK